MENYTFWLGVILAFAIMAVPIAGLHNRNKTKKGIGWQFIRFCVIATAFPLVGLLAINNSLSEGAIALISASLGFAFGKKEDDT